MENGATKAGEILGQVSGKAVEAMTVWTEANQRVLRELVDFSVGAAREGVRLCDELQQRAMEAARDGQATAMKWQATWQDPMACYQQAVALTVDGAQRFFRLLEGNAQAFSRSAERLQTSAEQTAKGIQETFEKTVSSLKDTYSRN